VEQTNRFVESSAQARVVGETGCAADVVELAASSDAELVFLDMDFDAPSGTTILKALRDRLPETTVIVMSALSSARATMEALSLGALEYVCTEPGKLQSTPLAPQIERAVHNAWVVNRKPTAKRKSKAAPASDLPESLRRSYDMVLIGISTGGPAALEVVVEQLAGADLPPVLIVQHMGRFFTAQLAETLTRAAGRPVKEGREGMMLEPGSIVVAPGGMHCEIGMVAPQEDFHRLRIRDSAPVNGCRPSVDVTWRSFARFFGGDVLSILMTGMGEDGAEGLAVLKGKGAVCVAQDEASSVVWGMPGAAVAAGTPHEVLSLEQIAELLATGVERK